MTNCFIIGIPIYIAIGILTLMGTRTPYDGKDVNWATFIAWPVVWVINLIKLFGRVINGLIEIAKE